MLAGPVDLQVTDIANVALIEGLASTRLDPIDYRLCHEQSVAPMGYASSECTTTIRPRFAVPLIKKTVTIEKMDENRERGQSAVPRGSFDQQERHSGGATTKDKEISEGPLVINVGFMPAGGQPPCRFTLGFRC